MTELMETYKNTINKINTGLMVIGVVGFVIALVNDSKVEA